MANRYPLVVDSSSSVIKELPSTDALELGNCDIANVGNITINTKANLGAVGNVIITGGSSGQVLKTDGAGNLSWAADSATAGGSNTQVQFNDAGSIGGNANLVFNKSTSNLTVTGNIIVSSNANVTGTANVGNVYTSGTMTSVGNTTVGNLLCTLGTAFLKDSSHSNAAIIANTGYLIMQTVTNATKFIALQAPSSISDPYIAWSLPSTAGNIGQFLTQNGAGVMSWGNVTISSSAPASAVATGTAGQVAYDSSYIYVCVATNTWKRAALTTW